MTSPPLIPTPSQINQLHPLKSYYDSFKYPTIYA